MRLLIVAFDNTNTRIDEIGILDGVGCRTFAYLKAEIYMIFSKWIEKINPNFAKCKILWLHTKAEGIEWVDFGSTVTAVNMDSFTDIYKYSSSDGQIISESYVR